MAPRALSIALGAALALAGAAVVMRLLEASAAGANVAEWRASQLLPLLFAGAGLCTAGLLQHRAPAGAWLATVSVGGIAALETLGSLRAQFPIANPQAGPWLVLMASASLIAAAGIAAAYAARPANGPRARGSLLWRLIVLAGLAAVTVTTGWVAAQAFLEPVTALAAEPLPGELPPLRISARLAAGFIAVMALAGIGRDLSGPLRRARSRAASVRELPRSVAEELLPGASVARRHGRDEERARIAADLHALVLPDLRRAAQAAADAEAAAAEEGRAAQEPPGVRARPVAADLRHAVEGVERLMHERQSIVLEEYGLVAGLEWLAERTEQRAAIAVDVELEGAQVEDPGAVSPAIARAAFRVALLALDNVVRHAGASRTLIRLDLESGRGRLAVVDNGRGIDDATASRAGRGLIDMRTAATEIGATLNVERQDGGTAVEMTWASATAAAGDPVTAVADLTTRPFARRA